MKHAPTPWSIGRDGLTILPAHPKTAIVASVFVKVNDMKESYANAEFIVRACNAHDGLVRALEEVKQACKGVEVPYMLEIALRIVDRELEAVKKTEGK